MKIETNKTLKDYLKESEDKKHIECGCRDRCDPLVAASLWRTRPDQRRSNWWLMLIVGRAQRCCNGLVTPSSG
jgi:hypothetical protein